jgi:LysR family cys regulon transcriptional activator
MDIRQLQAFITLIGVEFSVSRTASEMFLVQSAVSQQLKRLEQELGSDLFVRKGKRLVGLTDFGQRVEHEARAALQSIGNIQRIAEDELNSRQGILRIGCTHTQGRYVLPPVIHRFNRQFPEVELQMHQGNPRQLVEWAVNDQVDFSICTEELAQSEKLESIPCYRWNRYLITLPDHPLQQVDELSLDDLCNYPLITYVMGFTGRGDFDRIFEQAGLKPNIVLSAADTDIIKAYVLDGLGVGVVAGMALNPSIDLALQLRDLSHLFPWETTRIAYRKNRYIRRHQQTFIQLILEHISGDRSERFLAA